MNKQIEEYRNNRARLNERLLSKENEADIIKRVFAMDTYAYNDRQKGLSAKDKEIIGLATSLVLRCDDCVKYHLEKCYELCVANDEMMDIFGVANVVGGTIVIPHTRKAIEYWEILNKERPAPGPFVPQTKDAMYGEAFEKLIALLDGVDNDIAKMASINEVLKHTLPYYYWVGFYLAEKERLVVGPYQGTHGCLFITYGAGVCGRAASQKETIIVGDINKLNELQATEGKSLHIVCDPRCQSEIVVPVTNKDGNLLAVFDVDSLHTHAFDQVDQLWLEKIIAYFF